MTSGIKKEKLILSYKTLKTDDKQKKIWYYNTDGHGNVRVLTNKKGWVRLVTSVERL